MKIPEAGEKWPGRVATVTIGATQAEGGTRGRRVTIGGASGIPFLSFDGQTPNPPAIAMEVFDTEPAAWPRPLEDAYGDVWSDPAAWARRVSEFGADLVNLRLLGTHPVEGDRSPEEAVETVRAVLEAVDLPLIVWGCLVPEKDRKVLPKVAEATQGENCLLAAATEADYRTLTAAATLSLWTRSRCASARSLPLRRTWMASVQLSMNSRITRYSCSTWIISSIRKAISALWPNG